ncbi:metallophosphoesterase family protein [Photobacterium damselae]|uniref:metallophosphoesterase family protein n=1 Tax=Photobacterium damselae TaxID=38293 RepID=UPI001F28EE8D|nr:metallophosphoesterase [Photobacterium damselae]UKA09463.1 metallophosphoesterase [Photobacterium damselae subsp. damselae]
MKKIKFLVVSDLHSTVSEDSRNESRLIFNQNTNKSDHALAFIDFVKNLNVDIDYLVCPGDISNKGDVAGFKAGWNFLHELKNELNASELLCVPGNHDHQSRPNTHYSVMHELKFVQPPFPTAHEDMNTNFWGWYWLHQEFEEFNVIKLNSSAYHGLNDEFKHGRVAVETADQIYNYLKNGKKFQEKKFNILLCHHHPMPMDEVDYEFDTQVMDGGANLLKKLDEANVGPWLVIHGHKHFANLSLGMTQRSVPPVIFSAGSLGASLYPKIEERTANQFYIISIDLQKTDDRGCLVGNFEAYSWNLRNGWHPSQCDNLPHKGGFGANNLPHKLVQEISKLLVESTYLDINDLKLFQDEINYYTPGQFNELLENMDKKNISYICNGNQIEQVAPNE